MSSREALAPLAAAESLDHQYACFHPIEVAAGATA